jgi:hypothetical protein
MPSARRPRLFTLFALVALPVALGAGCCCDDDEYNGKDACAQLVAAANSVLSTCGSPTVDDYAVCNTATGSCTEVSGCSARSDVDACAAEIKKLGCNDVSSRTYASAGACVGVLKNISSSCSGGGDDDD